MKRPRRNRSMVIALWANAAVLLAILAVMLSRGNTPTLLPAAFGSTVQPPPIAGGGNLYLMPGQFSTSTWGCYIMDIDSQTLCAYQYIPGDHYLHLVAARDFHWDRRLRNFNTVPPWPEVQKLVELEKQNVRSTENPPKTTSQPSEDSR